MQSNKRQHNKRNLLIIMIMLQMKKRVANNLVIATKQKSLDNINSLSSNNDVENAKVAGINEIANVLPATAVKSKSKKDIDQKLAQQINQIQTHQTATTEEKSGYSIGKSKIK